LAAERGSSSRPAAGDVRLAVAGASGCAHWCAVRVSWKSGVRFASTAA